MTVYIKQTVRARALSHFLWCVSMLGEPMGDPLRTYLYGSMRIHLRAMVLGRF